MEDDGSKKKRILCLHGFRTSGIFLKKQISRWDPSIFSHFDMDFPDGLFPAGGKSEIEEIFPGPYFEWFQYNPDFTEYTHLEECIAHVCEYITREGPFDGLLGFSQGATLSGLLLGYQKQGKVLQEHPPFKLFVSISGARFRKPVIAEVAYKDPINVKSVHFIGDKDYLKLPSEEFATGFVDPLIFRHPKGHMVPRLDDTVTEQLRNWTKAFQIGGIVTVEGKLAVPTNSDGDYKVRKPNKDGEVGQPKENGEVGRTKDDGKVHNVKENGKEKPEGDNKLRMPNKDGEIGQPKENGEVGRTREDEKFHETNEHGKEMKMKHTEVEVVQP